MVPLVLVACELVGKTTVARPGKIDGEMAQVTLAGKRRGFVVIWFCMTSYILVLHSSCVDDQIVVPHIDVDQTLVHLL